MRLRTIVTDAQQRTALNVIQYLGRKKIHVIAIEKDIYPKLNIPGFLSRYSKEKYIAPDVEKAPLDYIKFINSLAKKDKTVLIPIKTSTIQAISKYRNRLNSNIIYCLPSNDALNLALNKELLYQKASKMGIKVPRTYSLRNLKELAKVAKTVKYPVIVKVREERNLFQENRYVIVNNAKLLIREYKKMHYNVQEFPIIQEYILGRGTGFHALFNKKKVLVAYFMHKRIREYPITGGPSTLCKGIYDPKLKEAGLKLLKGLDWTGLAMVEFKIDRRGVPWLMEINPRFWGSFPLAVESGVNFPYLLYQVSTDQKPSVNKDYKRGIKLRFLFSDLKAAEQYLFTKPEKFKFLKGFIHDLFDRKIKEANIFRDDIVPVLPFLIEYFTFLLKGKKALPKMIKNI